MLQLVAALVAAFSVFAAPAIAADDSGGGKEAPSEAPSAKSEAEEPAEPGDSDDDTGAQQEEEPAAEGETSDDEKKSDDGPTEAAPDAKDEPETTKPASPAVERATPRPKKRAGPSPVLPKLRVSAPPPKPIDAYGPISVGHPHEGFLVNGVEMPKGKQWVISAPQHRWGTRETVDALIHCIERVNEQFDATPPAMLGSISARHGGQVPPHKSHRSGRDVDLYFYRLPGAKWYRAATATDIDLPRTWAALRCVVTESDVDYVLIDQKVQRWIEAYALAAGEDPDWIRDLFHDTSIYRRAVVKHVPGHVAHMHIRYVSPRARQLGRKLYDRLVDEGIVRPPVAKVVHTVRAGDTLGALAISYKTSVAAIQKNNGLEGELIKVGQVLTIQQPRDLRGARDPIYVPPRRLPRKRTTGPVALGAQRD